MTKKTTKKNAVNGEIHKEIPSQSKSSKGRAKGPAKVTGSSHEKMDMTGQNSWLFPAYRLGRN